MDNRFKIENFSATDKRKKTDSYFIEGKHLEKGREHTIKQKTYNMDDRIDYLKFMLGEGSGKIFEDENTELINFYETDDNIKKAGMLGEHQKYVISNLDKNPKRSFNYKDCTAVIVCGEDEKGEQISFMTHQNPGALIGVVAEKFIADISLRISEIRSRCKSGSIDIVIAGGNYYDKADEGDALKRTNTIKYEQSIEFLRRILVEQFSENERDYVEPTVIMGPDFSEPISEDQHNDIVFDTQARIAFMARPKQHIALTDDIYSPENLNGYLNKLNQIKKDFDGWKPAFLQTRLREEVRNKLTQLKEKPHDITPEYEQKTYNELRENNVQVWAGFRRVGNAPADVFVDMPLNIGGDAKYIGEFDMRATILRSMKIEEIKNLDSFFENIISDLKIISQKHYRINNSKETLGYFFDEINKQVNFIVGRHGFYYIERDIFEGYEEVILQNIAMFLESFHRFCDEYVVPATRNIYIKQVHLHVRDFFEKTISKDEIDEIYSFM